MEKIIKLMIKFGLDRTCITKQTNEERNVRQDRGGYLVAPYIGYDNGYGDPTLSLQPVGDVGR